MKKKNKKKREPSSSAQDCAEKRGEEKEGGGAKRGEWVFIRDGSRSEVSFFGRREGDEVIAIPRRGDNIVTSTQATEQLSSWLGTHVPDIQLGWLDAA